MNELREIIEHNRAVTARQRQQNKKSKFDVDFQDATSSDLCCNHCEYFYKTAAVNDRCELVRGYVTQDDICMLWRRR